MISKIDTNIIIAIFISLCIHLYVYIFRSDCEISDCYNIHTANIIRIFQISIMTVFNSIIGWTKIYIINNFKKTKCCRCLFDFFRSLIFATNIWLISSYKIRNDDSGCWMHESRFETQLFYCGMVLWNIVIYVDFQII
jgi:hypothetical protein